MKKKALALVLSLMIVMLAATAQALTVNELLETTQANMALVKSYEAQLTAKLVMSAEDESVNMTIKGTTKYVQDPLCIKSTVTTKVGKETVKIESYGQMQGDELVMYMVMDGKVSKMSLALNDATLAQLKGATPQDYLAGFKDIEYAGTQKIGGRKTYVLSVKLDATVMEQQASEQLAGMGLEDMEGIDLGKLLKGLSDIPVKLYIDAKTMMYTRMEIDMTGIMEGILSSLGAGDEITIDEYTMTMDYKNYNKVKAFSVPASIIKKAG